jgi:hypothetical protein
MDNESQNEAPKEKPRRGRRPKSETLTDSAKLKRIELDEELKQLIEKKTSPNQLENFRVKLPPSVIEEIRVNVDSLNQSGKTKMDVNAYVRYALELANENLKDVLKRHFSQ